MEQNGTKNEHKMSTEYRCEKCTYVTVRNNDYNKHVLTAEHQLEQNGTKNEHKMSTNYSCEKCNYITVRKNNYERHLLTARHLMEMSEHKMSAAFECEHCNKIYQTSAGLWKHKKNCIIEPIATCDKDELIMDVLQQNKELNKLLIEQTKQAAEKAQEQSKQNAELHAKIIELCKNGVVNNTITNTNNSHNKSFNLNFFLNETCKDAMNISDFANSIVLQLSDIDAIGKAGYVNGMTNIITSHLNSLAENKRPIHCTDVKREVMYVKDEDKWQKDENKKKMRLLIRRMDKKLTPVMATYTNNYNKMYRSDAESIQHSQLRYEIYGGKNEESVNEDNIIRNISKKVGGHKSP
jgi:hypothetical protein